MRRRDFTALVVGSTMMRPLRVYAQQSQKIARLGILLPGAPATESLRTNAFLDGLRELGYVEERQLRSNGSGGRPTRYAVQTRF